MEIVRPFFEKGNIRLYGEMNDVIKSLIVLIDDDPDEEWAKYFIKPILKESYDYPVWLLHITSFGEGQSLFADRFTFSLFGNYEQICKQAEKIYLLDLREQDSDRGKITANNILTNYKSTHQIIVVSGYSGDIRDIKEKYNIKAISKSSLPQDLIIELKDVLGKDELADLPPNYWHSIRIDGERNFPDPHHWPSGGAQSVTTKKPDDLWEHFSSVQLSNGKKLQTIFSECGYEKDYESLMFSSTLSKPAIRELLQIDSIGNDLTHFVERIKSNLGSEKITVTISLEGPIINDYLWFNICAVYRSFRSILKGYSDELNKMHDTQMTTFTPSMNIHLQEENNGVKGLRVIITLSPLKVLQVSWPFSQKGVIKEHTKKLLQHIQNQGVDKVEYYAEDYASNKKTYIVNIASALVSGENSTVEHNVDGHYFTFRWLIPAYGAISPYNGLSVWTCKHNGGKPI